MNKHNKVETVSPPREFWEAVLQVHNHFFGPQLLEFMALSTEQQSCHIFRSLQILDIWLDVALSRGVLDASDE